MNKHPNATGKITAINNNKKACIAVIVFLCLLSYINTLKNDFVYDDHEFIVDNSFIKSLNNIPRFFSHKEAYSAEGNYKIYRPIAAPSCTGALAGMTLRKKTKKSQNY